MFISRYDSTQTLFYLDPPYFGGENDYGKGMFARDAYAHMADQLGAIKGAFLLSINDTPEIRELFSEYMIDEVRLSYTVAQKKSAGKVGELIFGNRETRAGLL